MATVTTELGERPPGLPYEGPRFAIASELARRAATRGWAVAVPETFAHHASLPAVVVDLWRLPRLEVTLTAAELAVWQPGWLAPAARRLWSGARAQAVLDLAATEAAYLHGRSSESVRGKLRRAAATGLVSGAVVGWDEWMEPAHAVFSAREGGPEELAVMGPPPAGQRMAYLVTWDSAGRPIAVAATARFGDDAALCNLVSLPGHPASGYARYQVHTTLRARLRAEGCTALVAGSALRETPGNQVFQHRLGYEVRTLRLRVVG